MSGSFVVALPCVVMVVLVGASGRIAARPRVRRRPAPAAPSPARRTRRSSLRSWRAPRWWADLVADLGAPVEPGTGAAVVVALTVAAVAGGLLASGPALAAIAGLVVPAAVALAGALLRGRQGRLLVAALPEALDALARAAAAGAAPLTALREAAAVSPPPLSQDLAAIVARAELAEALHAALERWARLRPLAEVRLVVSGLVTASRTGGSLADAAGRLAATLRGRAEARRLVASQAAQARASATVVGVAPLAVVGVLSLVDSSGAGVLLGTPAGLGCLALGLAMDAAAVWWMASMIRAAE